MKKAIFYFLVVVMFSLSSCYTERVTKNFTIWDEKPSGWHCIHDIMIGQTYNQVLKYMGDVPARKESDGNGGMVVTYEKTRLITSSSSNSSYASSTQAGATAGYSYYGNPTVVSGSNTLSSSSYNSRTTTEQQRNFINFFINQNNVCYDVTASNEHYGYRNPGKYHIESACSKEASTGGLVASWLLGPMTLYLESIIHTIFYCNYKERPCE